MAFAKYNDNGYKTYRVMGTNRRGECITATFQSSNRANTKKWLAEVAEHEAWKGVTFTTYKAVMSDSPYKEIKAH